MFLAGIRSFPVWGLPVMYALIRPALMQKQFREDENMAVNGVTDYTNRYPINNNKYQEAGKTAETGKKNEGSSTEEYLEKLQKQVPTLRLESGSGLPLTKNNRMNLLTIHPKLLSKMQKDPEKEKESIQRLKDIEGAQKWLDGYMKSRGYTTKISHWYIDENGKASHLGYHVKEDRLSPKLREERRKNAEKLIEKTKEQADKKAEELKKILEEKISADGDGMVYLTDAEIQSVIEAAGEKSGNQPEKSKENATGAHVDVKI